MEQEIKIFCKVCQREEIVGSESCICFQETICGLCFAESESKKEQENMVVIEGTCMDCNAPIAHTVGVRKVRGDDAETCNRCYWKRYAESDEAKEASAKEKAEFDSKSVREKMIILLDEIDSCQDACHPSSLSGYHSCLCGMKLYAQRRVEFAEEYRKKAHEIIAGKYLWDLLVAIEEIASKYEDDPSLEKCKEMANFIEGFTAIRFGFPI